MKLALRRLSRGPIVESAAVNVALAILGALTGVAAARILGATGRGELAAIRVPGLLLAGLATLGLPDAMVHFVRRDPDRVGPIVGASFTLAALASVAAGLLGIALVPILLRDSSSQVMTLGRWWMAIPLLMTFGGIPVMAFRAIGRDRLWNLLRVIPGLIWLIVLIVAASQPQGDRLGFLVFGHLAGLAVLGAVAWIALRRRLVDPIRPGREQWPRLLRYGAPLSLAAVPQIANTRFDQLLLIPFVSSEELGFYVAAVAFATLSTPVVSAFGIVLFPRISEAKGANEIKRLILRYVRPAIVTAALVAAVGASTAPFLLPLLFGSGFDAAVPVSQILLPAGAILACSEVLKSVLLGLARTSTILSSEITGLVFNIAGLAILVPAFGIVGAAVASLLAYAVTFLMRFRAMTRASGLTATEITTRPLRHDDAAKESVPR